MKFFLVLLLSINSAFAAAPRTAAVNLPSLSAAGATDRVRAPKPRLEVLASSWQPASMNFESRSRETGSFTAAYTPKLSLTALSVLSSTSYGNLSTRFGAGFLPMEREGKISFAASSQLETQSLYLFPGEAGLQFEPSLLQWRGLAFQLSASARPTLAVLSKSALGDSKTQTGMGYEVSAGGSYAIGSEGGGTEITASVAQNYGKLKTSDLRGFGIQAGLRVGL